MKFPGCAVVEVGPLRFAHPESWVAQREDADEGITISLQSPQVSFALVCVYPADHYPDDIMDQALESLRDEHPGLEVDDIEDDFEELWDEEETREVVFMSLDTVTYCWLRSGRLAEATLLVLVQTIDREADLCRRVFQAICRSIHVSDATGG